MYKNKKKNLYKDGGKRIYKDGGEKPVVAKQDNTRTKLGNIEPNKEVTFEKKPALDYKSRSAGAAAAMNANPYAKKHNTVLPEVVITPKARTDKKPNTVRYGDGATSSKKPSGQGSSSPKTAPATAKKKSGTKKYSDLDPKIQDAAKAWNMKTYGSHNPTSDAKKAGISKAELAKRYKNKGATPGPGKKVTPLTPKPTVRSVPTGTSTPAKKKTGKSPNYNKTITGAEKETAQKDAKRDAAEAAATEASEKYTPEKTVKKRVQKRSDRKDNRKNSRLDRKLDRQEKKEDYKIVRARRKAAKRLGA